MVTNQAKTLLQQAEKAAQNAYAPYSGFLVGAAVETGSGKIYSGCNIENASYGATVCAERVAIWKAVSEEVGAEKAAPMKIVRLAVFIKQEQPWPPCGLCRQVVAEFADDKTEIICGNHLGHAKIYLFKDLFPDSFGPSYLTE